MTAQSNMHCKNPFCFDDDCRGDCETPESPEKDVTKASEYPERYCED